MLFSAHTQRENREHVQLIDIASEKRKVDVVDIHTEALVSQGKRFYVSAVMGPLL